MINVHDFGAKGDGKTDDAAAIQAAFDAAAPSNEVSLHAGTFMVSCPIYVHQDNFALLGSNTGEGTVLRTTANYPANSPILVFCGTGLLRNVALYWDIPCRPATALSRIWCASYFWCLRCIRYILDSVLGKTQG